MRSPVDLLELPYTFTQIPPLMPRDFIREARERGVRLSEAQLEALHRVRLLTPMFRVRRDTRLVARLVRQDHIGAWQAAQRDPTTRQDLVDALAQGRLTRAAGERFISRESRARVSGDLSYLASDYVYSLHQLLMLPTISSALPYLRWRRRGPRRVPVLEVNRYWRGYARTHTAALQDAAIAASALEPVYYPRIVGSLSLGSTADFAPYDRWREELPPRSMLEWLGVDAEWLKRTGEVLLNEADRFDPLGDWLELVRTANPSKWKRLRGDARSAMDLRVAAEILLRYYDDIARAKLADPLPVREGLLRGPFDSRLKHERRLDEMLTKYGLSPHPSLLLVVEGYTELDLFPRVMRLLGVRLDRDFIAIETMEGVGRDISALASFAIAPQTELDDDGRYLRLSRPLTRILVITDPEGPMKTSRQRRHQREVLVQRIMRTLPEKHRTESVRDSLGRLVHYGTWGRSGLSFEFVHFTDRELATAISHLDPKPHNVSVRTLTARVASVRARHGNIDTLLGSASKLALADALWPVLQRKIARAEARGTENSIPIVRVIGNAVRLASELQRSNVVIPLAARLTPRTARQARAAEGG